MPLTTSFPSGHSSTAVVAAILLSAARPQGRPVYWASAALVASSRVYVRIHHASDVVGGVADRARHRHSPPAAVREARRHSLDAVGRRREACRDADPRGMPGHRQRFDHDMTHLVLGHLGLPLPVRPQRPRPRGRGRCSTAPTGTSPSSRSRSGQVHVDEGEPDIWDDARARHRPPRPAGRRRRARPAIPTSSSPSTGPSSTPATSTARQLATSPRSCAAVLDRSRGRRRRRSSPRSPPARRSRRSARSTRPRSPTTRSGACRPSSPATRRSFVRLMDDADGDAGGRPSHRRAHRRPAHRLARAQRVQAHQPEPLTRSRRTASLATDAGARVRLPWPDEGTSRQQTFRRRPSAGRDRSCSATGACPTSKR